MQGWHTAVAEGEINFVGAIRCLPVFFGARLLQIREGVTAAGGTPRAVTSEYFACVLATPRVAGSKTIVHCKDGGT